ncbi:MAG: hypothetical protein ACQEUT_16645 [Bacillota bacterium]
MNEKKLRLSLTGALVILSICSLISASIISSAIRDSSSNGPKSEEEYRYEFISANEQNVIIFDKETGDHWRKFIEPNEGPAEWEKQPSPVDNQ